MHEQSTGMFEKRAVDEVAEECEATADDREGEHSQFANRILWRLLGDRQKAEKEVRGRENLTQVRDGERKKLECERLSIRNRQRDVWRALFNNTSTYYTRIIKMSQSSCLRGNARRLRTLHHLLEVIEQRIEKRVEVLLLHASRQTKAKTY